MIVFKLYRNKTIANDFEKSFKYILDYYYIAKIIKYT